MYFASSPVTMLLPIEYLLPDPQTFNISDDRRHSLAGLKLLSDTCIHEWLPCDSELSGVEDSFESVVETVPAQ